MLDESVRDHVRDAPHRPGGGHALSFAAPPRVREGALDDDHLHQVLAAFGITRGRVVAHQWVDNGPGWAVVQLPTAEEVLALEPDLSLIPDAMIGAIGAHPRGHRHHIGAVGTRRPVAELREHGLLRDTTTFVHGNGISDEGLRMLADAGSSLSISPDVELKMGFGPPMTGRALVAGLRPTLSIDDVPSVGGDMFSTMRTVFAVQRGLDGGLRSRDLLEFATVDAARSCGLDARTGSITPGKDADVILLRTDDLTVFPVTDPVATIVSAGHPGLVDTVLVAGRVVKRDGVLVGVDLPASRSRLVASRDRIAAAAGIPLDGTWRPRPESE